MNIKIVESSLNLRIERGKKKEDYSLSKVVADKQLSFQADIYANVEFMSCDNDAYLQAFEDAGYNSYVSIDYKGRGILCEIKNEYEVTKIGEMSNPHMLHLRIRKGHHYIDLITIRILVSDGTDADFRDRKKQWQEILSYINNLSDKSHIILTGDFNHGVIAGNINEYCFKPRQYFNYQMVVSNLYKKTVTLHPIEGSSYRGYMRIDHIATGEKITVNAAEYNDLFNGAEAIGIPDHKSIVANISF